MVDRIGQLAVVDGGRQLVGPPGHREIHPQMDVDQEDLPAPLLFVVDTVVGEDPDAVESDPITHHAEMSARPSGPSGRPMISWITAAATIGSLSRRLDMR